MGVEDISNTEDTATPKVYISRQKLPDAVAKAYELSRPQGMGQMHFIAGALPQASLDALMSRVDEGPAEAERGKQLTLDYIHGRAVKLTFFWDVQRQKHYIEDDGTWFDHFPDEHRVLVGFIQQGEGGQA